MTVFNSLHLFTVVTAVLLVLFPLSHNLYLFVSYIDYYSSRSTTLTWQQNCTLYVKGCKRQRRHSDVLLFRLLHCAVALEHAVNEDMVQVPTNMSKSSSRRQLLAILLSGCQFVETVCLPLKIEMHQGRRKALLSNSKKEGFFVLFRSNSIRLFILLVYMPEFS